MDQPTRVNPLPNVSVILLTITAAVAILFGMRQYAEILGPLLLTVNLFIAAYPIQPGW